MSTHVSSSTAASSSASMPDSAVIADIVPKHVGIIMDGNRRWARKQEKVTVEGHKAGSLALEKIVEECGKLGVETLTVYAFSSENFVKRTKKEVDDLIRLLMYFLRKKRAKLQEHGAKLTILGEMKAFPKTMQRAVDETTNILKDNTRIKLNIALNYGGRSEIIQAVKSMISQGVKPEDVNEELLSSYLYTKDSTDPDLIIRTGGELRLSNFLIWQASYAEFYFTPVLWPDFSPDEFRKALEDYARRQRRYGK